MEKAEIKQIADYLKDLEEGLVEWDYRGITTQGNLTKLYGIIERLMQATLENLLKKLYPSRTAQQISDQIGRPVPTIRKIIFKLGLKKRKRKGKT